MDRASETCVGRNFLAGEWVHGDNGDSIPVEDPGNLELIGTAARARAVTVDLAVSAGKTAFEAGGLSRMAPLARAGMMRRIAAEIRKLKPSGGRLLCQESGKPLRDAEHEFEEAALYFEYYSGLSDKIEGKSIPLGDEYVDYTIREPYGVSAHIVPWNYPVSLAARSLAPALAAGNSVVVKAPELDPLALLRLGEAFNSAGVPPGTVSIICGYGHDAGAALVSHPRVDQIVFTGSLSTGQAVLEAAARTVTPCVVELGGKSAGIVFEDADLDRVIASVKSGIFYNSGQTCSAMSRLLVDRQIYAEVVERCVDLSAGLTIGHGLENPDITPLISAAQLDRVETMVSKARQSGGCIASGGRRAERSGHFMLPTIIADVDPNSPIARDEVFGPVLCIMPFDTEEEAFRLANDNEYGLVAGVFTRSLNRALTAPPRLRGGQVFVNRWFAGGINTPFGGVGKSGFGREKGVEALSNYLRTKNVAIHLGAG